MHFFSSEIISSKNEEINHPILKKAGVSLHIKREDLIDTEVSGNKYRKLKYNISEAKKRGLQTLLTFGGAYSNHIAATAAAGSRVGLKTIGIIRGEELGRDLQKTVLENSTLRFALDSGMQLEFVSRSMYRDKTSIGYLEELKRKYGDFYLLPEGGTNHLAIQGCQEILNADDTAYDVICCAVGTGGTISGIINSASDDQRVLGFPALKGDFLSGDITEYTVRTNWELINDYHFGGYAKVDGVLVDFINTFRKEQDILLDPIYTGKMIFGLFDMIQNGFFKKNTRILAIYTGGLQGISGMNKRLAKQNLPLITI